ncbi:Enhancer of polycomb-like protein 1 [Astathelohania contejeani]|uniref:Enhancer of polycomb-like protein 1 n=1 Tax=Astathelohania contejeani TaxID=164912 RepID=A0ABQ7HWN7_9MICR|nr:Enhancer of polycomb-like protein 1 [Thelohania contejeani]
MIAKRIRNKKLENEIKYKIYRNTEINKDLTAAYTANNISSGMEQEEEKELHLKEVIAGKQDAIPLPQIDMVDNIVEYTPYKRCKEMIRYDEDVPNKYIMTADDLKYCKSVDCTVDEFNDAVLLLQSGNYEGMILSEKMENLKDYILKRIIKNKGDEKFDAYVCFRKRTIKQARKSRKSEGLYLEKLKRMQLEVYLINKMMELKKLQCEKEKKLLWYKQELLGLCSSIGDTKSRKRMAKRIFGKEKIVYEQPFYKTLESFTAFIKNRRKMNAFKNKFMKETIEVDKEMLDNEVTVIYKNLVNNKT